MIYNYIATVKKRWSRIFQNSGLSFRLALMLFLLGVAGYVFSLFLRYIQHREGIVIQDPVLDLLKARDVSVYIFAVLYANILIALIYFVHRIDLFFLLVSSYIFLLIFRIISIYLVPLEMPEEYITLKDPIIDNLIYNGVQEPKDLFFSGHVAILILFCLHCRLLLLKYFYLLSATLLGFLMLIQHGHYTIDILVAPLGAYLCYRLAHWIPRKYLAPGSSDKGS